MTHEPIDDMLKALRDELAGVAPSPEFASRVRERVAGELPLLREELAAVAPSPEFKVRVREQIEAADQARRASWLFGRRWLVPATLAAAALLAVVLVPRKPETPAPMRPIPDLSQVTIVDGPLERSGATPPRPKSVDARAGRTAPLRTSNFEVRTSKAEPADGPSLEVITNQPDVIREWWSRFNAADVGAGPTADVEPMEMRDVVIAPVEVNPVVVKWLVEPPQAVPVLLPIIRGVSAALAERSVK